MCNFYSNWHDQVFAQYQHEHQGLAVSSIKDSI